MVNYNVLINVVPGGSVAQPVVTDVKVAQRDEINGIELVASNNGNRFYHAGMSEWSISAKTQDGQDYNRDYRRGEFLLLAYKKGE